MPEYVVVQLLNGKPGEAVYERTTSVLEAREAAMLLSRRPMFAQIRQAAAPGAHPWEFRGLEVWYNGKQL